MAKCEIVAGSVDQTIDVFIQDSSVTTGAGLTGLVFNTANLVCYYRKGATGTPTALSLVTQTVGGAHSDGGFVAVDGTNCPGQYRLDLSDTIVATPGRVTIYLRGAANMTPCLVEIEIVAVNKYDAVRGGLTALPNANAEAAGLPLSQVMTGGTLATSDLLLQMQADLMGLPRPPRIPRASASEVLPLMLLSFMSESRRLDNARMKRELRLRLTMPHVRQGLSPQAGLFGT